MCLFTRGDPVDFPKSTYRFSRSITVSPWRRISKRTRQGIDLAREFCAQKTSRGWTLSDKGMGYLRVEDLDMSPDPAIPGQGVRFRVRLRNDGKAIVGPSDPGQGSGCGPGRQCQYPRGVSDIQFPYANYSFQRFDHCFTVVVDFERTRIQWMQRESFVQNPQDGPSNRECQTSQVGNEQGGYEE